MGTGNIIAISISKIKKITVIIKNRNEKESRVLWEGSNPHSKQACFSFMLRGWLLMLTESVTMIKINNKQTDIRVVNIKIFLWTF